MVRSKLDDHVTEEERVALLERLRPFVPEERVRRIEEIERKIREIALRDAQAEKRGANDVPNQ